MRAMSERRFPDLWVDPENDPRESDRQPEGERETLLNYLRNQRLTFQLKCDGLDAQQLAQRSVPPSSLSLLGLMRHLADVEHSWFRQTIGGSDQPRHYRTAEDRYADFNGAVADLECVAEARAIWQSATNDADAIIAGVDDLGATFPLRDGERIALREVLVHMVEEYARHNGHADLLRERIDERTGQ